MSAGVDATHPATDDLIRLASQLLRGPPAFFGRYFKGPHNSSPVQYQAGTENPILSAHNIPVLCIARQTNRVGGSNADGVADAVNNMSAVVTSFGADYLAGLQFEPLIFLDTELGDNQPSLSADYFHGWADALRNQGPIGGGVQLKFTPAIYINRSDAKAWRALATAISNGAMCRGAWVANYGRRTGVEGPPAWDPAQAGPKPPVNAPCPILAWQYAGDFEDVLDFTVRERGSIEQAHAGILARPRLARRRKISLERRNLANDRLGQRLLIDHAVLRERLHDLLARKGDRLNADATDELGNRVIEMPYPAGPPRPLWGGILQDRDPRRVALKQGPHRRQTPIILAGTSNPVVECFRAGRGGSSQPNGDDRNCHPQAAQGNFARVVDWQLFVGQSVPPFSHLGRNSCRRAVLNLTNRHRLTLRRI